RRSSDLFLTSATPCFFLNLSATAATLFESLIGFAETSSDTLPDDIPIRFDFKTFLYHRFFEPLTGIRKRVFPSRTNHTGVENSRPDFLPVTVICSSTEESRAFCMSELSMEARFSGSDLEFVRRNYHLYTVFIEKLQHPHIVSNHYELRGLGP